MFLKFTGFLLWVVAVAVTLGWILGIRAYVRSGSGVTRQTVNTTMLFFVSVVAVPAIGIAPFHLLWMFPASWLSGTLSLMLPFSLLSIPGAVFFAVCTIGIPRKL